MADNLTVTPGSGANIAADEISGTLHQRVKHSLGADGSATDAEGGAGNVNAGTQRVTLANDDPLVTRVGEVQVSPTTNTLLDRVKALLTGIILAAGTNIIGGARDAGPTWTTLWGVSGAPFTSANQSGSAASVTDAPTSGQKIVLDDLLISVDVAMAVTLKCETTGAVILGPVYLPANGTLIWCSRGKGKKLATADKKLQVQTSVSGNIMVDAGYHSEA
jgi:hypothetical protein